MKAKQSLIMSISDGDKESPVDWDVEKVLCKKCEGVNYWQENCTDVSMWSPEVQSVME